jgi:cellulose synthase/poly-beta-1,6-N-acetylglucosamine synthase-like glycosyltransferase
MNLSFGIDFASFIYRRLNPIPHAEKPKNLSISIIVPAYNEEEYIEDVVESLYDQSLQPKNVFVVNDNSKDSTHERCIELYNRHDTSMYYIRNKVNMGKAFGINYVVRNHYNELGDIVYINDGDVIAEKRCLEEIVNGFYQEDVAAVTGLPTLIASGSLISRAMTYGKEWQIKILSFKKVGQTARNGMYVLCGACTGYRKDVLFRYAMPTRTQTEDLDYTWVLIEKGYKLGFQEKATCVSYDVTGLKNHWKQTRRWHRGAWQAIYSHAGALNDSKSLLYTTLIPGWVDVAFFIAELAAIPLIYRHNPYLLAGFLAVDTAVNIGMTVAKKPAYVKYLPATMLYTGLWLASYTVSGIQTTYEKMMHQEYKWNNRWSKNATTT